MKDPMNPLGKPLGAKALPGKGLGRGLAALLGDEPSATPQAEAERAALAQDTSEVPIEFLRAGRFQPRRHFEPEALKALAQSIREKGLVQPIVVRPLEAKDSYEIVAGERRWRAAQIAQLHQVPVVIRALSDRDALELALIENLQRADLTPIEEGRGYRRLIDEFDVTQDVLATELGKSRSHIANTLRLLQLPESVQRLVEDGSLSAGHVRAMLTAPNIEVLAKDVAQRGLNVRQTEKLVLDRARAKSPSARGAPQIKPATKSADIRALERSVEQATGLKSELAALGKERTALTITCETYEQLDALVARLTRGD